MRKVLFVIPSLEFGHAGKQLSLLAAGLPRDRFEPRVCVLGRGGPFGKALAGAGVPADVLGWTRSFDVRPLLKLRDTLTSFRPDVIHVWQAGGLRAVALARALGGRERIAPSRLVAGAMFGAATDPHRFPDRILLGRADRVIVTGSAEARRAERAGVPADRLVTIPPAVEARPADERPREELLRELGLPIPPESRLLVCVGPFEPHKGYRDAVWAFDILHYLYPDLYLVLAGAGPDEDRLCEFAGVITGAEKVRFVRGAVAVPSLLQAAEVVWVPSRLGGGVNVALEALAAGRPVVATALPALAEVVRDGETGSLVPPGDKVALARQTRLLLEDGGRRRRLGEAGRLRAETTFDPAVMVRRHAEVYEVG